MKEYIISGDILVGIADSISEQELVRCKDCNKRNSWECWQYFLGRLKIPDDWFCADGEVREC